MRMRGSSLCVDWSISLDVDWSISLDIDRRLVTHHAGNAAPLDMGSFSARRPGF
jgi:hypothetical protein